MEEKHLKVKVIHKCETAADWERSSYVPAEGEIVTYKIDEQHDHERLKLGDGIHAVKDLPFVADKGDKGDPGYSPVRGTDYWTEADKEEMKAYVRSYIEQVILGGEW